MRLEYWEEAEKIILRWINLTFMEPYIARCVFYITNEMQLVLYYYQRSTCFGQFFRPSSGFIKLYVQPWMLSGFPAVYRWCGWVGTSV